MRRPAVTLWASATAWAVFAAVAAVVQLAPFVGPSMGLSTERAWMCGELLADLGADVVKVEPPGGDQTRTLLGSGAGYFPMFNRNKRSISLDLKSPAGVAEAKALCLGAKGTFIGRPFLYGLGAMGRDGVTKALEIIRKEMDITLALCGKRLVTDMGKEQIHR